MPLTFSSLGFASPQSRAPITERGCDGSGCQCQLVAAGFTLNSSYGRLILALFLFFVACSGTTQHTTSWQWVRKPDLSIVEDTFLGRAAISLRQVRIRNLGPAHGEGVLDVVVVDSLGVKLAPVELEAKIPFKIPPAALGGAEGRDLPIPDQLLARLNAGLLQSPKRFALRAHIRTGADDIQEADNVKTREWGTWLPLRPGRQVTIKFAFIISDGTQAAKPSTQLLRTPLGAHVVTGRSAVFYRPGYNTSEIELYTSDQLAHGSVFAVRLTLTDALTRQILQQHERIGVFDTLPPLLTSYRAILLRDGRAAIQVQAGDSHSGVPENGVATLYSLDQGRTWNRRIHSFAYDDMGRPALFETVIGPFTGVAEILLAVEAHDNAGNINVRLPADFRVLTAPRNTEHLLDYFGFKRVDGNPVFRPSNVARHARWVNAADSIRTVLLSSVPREHTAELERFERRRIQQLQETTTAFVRMDVQHTRFVVLDVPLINFLLADGSTATGFRLQEWTQ